MDWIFEAFRGSEEQSEDGIKLCNIRRTYKLISKFTSFSYIIHTFGNKPCDILVDERCLLRNNCPIKVAVMLLRI